jgi:chromosome segregation ATPase
MEDSPEDGRWLTFGEFAAARGISRESAIRTIRRKRWRRQKDNHGTVRALIPADWQSPLPDRPEDDPGDRPEDHAPVSAFHAQALAALEDALAALREAKDSEIATLHGVIDGLHVTIVRTEDRAGRAETDRDAERVRADRAEADREEERVEAERALTDERMRAHRLREQMEALSVEVMRADAAGRDKERAEAERDAERARADGLRDRIEALHEQLAARQEGLDRTEATRQAEAMVDHLREAHAGEVRALKAERLRLAAQIDGFADRADQAEARSDSLRARVDVLQRERDTARAVAQEAAEALRRAEEARRARGRWARLRAAWRQ